MAKDLVGRIEQRLHLIGQLPVADGCGRVGGVAPAVVRGPGHTQLPAHPGDFFSSVLLLLNKPVGIIYRCSLAKNAETFFRNSFSRSTSRSRASKALYFVASTG